MKPGDFCYHHETPGLCVSVANGKAHFFPLADNGHGHAPQEHVLETELTQSPVAAKLEVPAKLPAPAKLPVVVEDPLNDLPPRMRPQTAKK